MRALSEGDRILLTVADRGPGIPEADRGRVVERFVRLEQSRSQPGSGLGLSLASAVARLHGGELTLEDNEPGLKSVIALPRGGPRTECGMRPPAKRKQPSARRPCASRPPAQNAQPRRRSGVTLAERIVTAPHLVDAKAARARVAEWLAGLPAAEAKPLKALLAAHPTVDTLLESLAESSPYLWELASRDPERLLRLLDADPDQHLAASAGRERPRRRRDRRTKPRRCGCCAA